MLVAMTAPARDVLPVSDLEPPAPSALPRALGLAVVVLLVAAIASAVLVRDGDRSPAERFAAISAAVAAEPFAFEMTFGTLPAAGAGAGAGEAVELTMDGVVDPATQRTRAEMDLSAVLPEGMGLPAKISLVTDGQVAYVQVPAAPGAAPRWQKIEGAALTQGTVGGLPSGTNPLDSFEQLRAVDAEIEDLGSEDVRGTKTTHYRTRLDMAKVLATMPEEKRPAAGTPEAELFASMPPVPVDVWLDEQDRPRRQRMAFSIPADPMGARPAMEMTLQIEAFDFGTPVTIELPPADQIDDAGLFGSTPAS